MTKREIAHQGLQVEANATALVLRLVQLPPPPGVDTQSASWLALLKRLLSVAIRVQGKATKSWMAEFVFYGSPLASSHPKEQGKLVLLDFLCVLHDTKLFCASITLLCIITVPPVYYENL